MLRRIGFLLTNPVSDSAAVENMDAFRQGLRELGHIDGETIEIDIRSAEGDPTRFPALAVELVASRPEVVVAAQPQAATALMNATTVIPLVVIGINASVIGTTDLSRPGRNVTGVVASDGTQLFAKQVELLKETVPSVSRIAVLWNPTGSTREQLEEQMGASRFGVQIDPHGVRNLDDIDGALRAVAASRADALFTAARVLALPRRAEIAEFALRSRLPSVLPGREFIEAGGLLSYWANSKRNWWRAATYVDRILKGATPRDLPMEDPMLSVELVLNLCTAGALGITIPPAVLPRVSEAIPCAR